MMKVFSLFLLLFAAGQEKHFRVFAFLFRWTGEISKIKILNISLFTV